jgi:site-specific recombinase XerD
MKVDYPYVIPDTDRHGNVRLYYRRNGKRKIRITGEPGSPEFLRQYEFARDGKVVTRPMISAPSKGTFHWLCQEYYRSTDYRSLGKRTQHVRRLVLEGICLSKTSKGKERGSAPFALMEERHVRDIRDERADRPGSANNTLKALRPLFTWAKSAGHVSVNPAADVKQLGGSTEGWHTWTDDEVARFEAAHPIGTMARLAFALLRYTGVRRSDVVKLGRANERDGVLRFTITKGAERTIIDATACGDATYITTRFGKPFSVAGFGNKFREWCNEAGLPHCSAHGIRKYDATTAAENGATTHQLMAMFGWDSVKQAEIYTRKANQTKLAQSSMHLMASAMESRKSG